MTTGPYSVSCPTCHSPIGDPCFHIRNSGQPLAWPHAARRELARTTTIVYDIPLSDGTSASATFPRKSPVRMTDPVFRYIVGDGPLTI